MSRMADILLLLCSCRDGVCVWGALCLTGAPVLVLVPSGMLSAWDARLPPGFQTYGQADTQQGGVPTSSPQGLSPCLSCRNPRRGRGRRTARAAKPPPLSRRSISERGQRSDSGDSDHPHLSSQQSSACQPYGLRRAASGGTGRNICVLGDSALPPGSYSRACPVSVGEMPFPPSRLGPCPPPAGSGSWGGRENPGVSPGCCLTFLLQPFPREMFSRGRVSPAHCLCPSPQTHLDHCPQDLQGSPER